MIKSSVILEQFELPYNIFEIDTLNLGILKLFQMVILIQMFDS